MRSRFSFLLAPLVAGLLFAACSNEGEGQPCDPNAGNSGNDDCQSGLVCTPGLNNVTGARCCPQDRALAKTTECAESTNVFDGGATSPPAEAAAAETSTSEAAASEASLPEASTSDAPAESAAETGTGVETGAGADASDGASGEAAGD